MSHTYKVIIVEDVPSEAEALRALLERYGQEHDVALQIVWLASAEDLGRAQECDLILMDIALPELSGMEMAALIRTYDEITPIIFITNLAQYALRGYEVGAFDFILKPVSYWGLSLRMDRVMRVLRRTTGKTLRVQTKNGFRAVPASQITHIEVTNHMLAYHTTASDEILLERKPLSKVEEDLAGSTFVRISQSFLVNMRHVRRVDSDSVVLADGTRVFFSRAKRKGALEEIARYFGDDIP